ncbi:hypothetical protein F3Y22_tig00110956pilonHSYRG00087 [Hibiscus syriacus]|uniref:Uncharacterized protein n=2 Tax=Hibiscus syriacus TaxID=106335 RepID=A0A6A2ZCF5_HIBSY|nr:hypothetical protein F3Y22_tig00110956pilonHSYRG00087 [Hibiscus syriacus]
MEANWFSISTESGGKHEIEVVKKRSGGAAASARGGGGGDAPSVTANGGGDGGGGDIGSGSGGQIPVYTPGAVNNNRVHRRNVSNSGTISRVGSSCLALIFFTCVPLFTV